MPNHNPSDKAGGRKLAPHVAAAIAAGAQPKMPDPPPGGRTPAPHVAAATGAAQPKTQAAPPGARPMAPHVQAAIGAGVQPKMPPTPPGGRTMAPHVQAATETPPTPISANGPAPGNQPSALQMMKKKKAAAAPQPTHTVRIQLQGSTPPVEESQTVIHTDNTIITKAEAIQALTVLMAGCRGYGLNKDMCADATEVAEEVTQWINIQGQGLKKGNSTSFNITQGKYKNFRIDVEILRGDDNLSA